MIKKNIQCQQLNKINLIISRDITIASQLNYQDVISGSKAKKYGQIQF